MPQFVRAGLRYNRWLETEGRQPLEFPADVLTDLRTTGDELSVYEVTETITAERIAIALAAGKQDPDHTSYALFNQADVKKLIIAVSREKPGSTYDAGVNALHRDLKVGTAARLLALAELLARGQIVPILKDRVTKLLKEGFENGQLDHTKNPRLRDRVKAKIPTRPDEPH